MNIEPCALAALYGNLSHSSEIPSLFGKKKESNDGNTQNGLTYAALNDSCVKQVDKSVSVVMKVDGVTPRVVTMSPK